LGFRDLDVDDILFEFLERVQRLEAPRSGRLLDDQGFTYAPACKCGHTERVFAQILLDEAGDQVFERWICAACDRPWCFNAGAIAVHEVRLPKGPGFEDKLSEVAQMQQALELLSVWEQRLYLQLYLWEKEHDRATVARIANKRWRTSRWSEWKARRAISSAQHKIHHALGLRARVARQLDAGVIDWQLEDHKL
jgi:hypothetical protein